MNLRTHRKRKACQQALRSKGVLPECDHDWKFISDWYGDPGVINGTADCSRWECQLCGAEDYERDPPCYDDYWEDDYWSVE